VSHSYPTNERLDAEGTLVAYVRRALISASYVTSIRAIEVTDLPIEVLKVDHVAMATWDARGPAHLLTGILGASFVDGGDEQHAGFRWLQFQLPGGKIEVLEPLHRDGFLYKFLTKRGEGLHHVTLYVADLNASLPVLENAGYKAVDVNLAHNEWKEAFLHPRDTPGVLIQLAQVRDVNAPYAPPKDLQGFLDDHVDLKP
jgi:methylmalonyl-CoA epimerase